MTPEQMERSLYALARQEGGYISVRTIIGMLQVRDERIRELSELLDGFIRDGMASRRVDVSRSQPDGIERSHSKDTYRMTSTSLAVEPPR